ncbi:hypothetical protein [Pseudorhodoferax soli]|uniref:PQ loop repeat protein n=1 Tax=Pseudorhodoferax soli TaxID=545864 RepID=A0A368XHR0_9BURK|nr:hypothetical protein [Pseudorhodoferax soli]RCW67542.1 hypothetical protein DES41_109265 [Pseudorhodoferax soli]
MTTPWSMGMPDGPLALIAWAYLLTNAVRMFTYVPQIVTVWRCQDGARSLSLLTWWSWVLSHITAIAYGVLVVRDLPFLMITLINLAGCGAVAAIAMRRRAQWRRRTLCTA